jgi:hypothetical protein
MAIYRPASRRPLVVVGAVALLLGLVAGFVAGQATAPGLEASVEGLRDRTAMVRSSLEVLRVEYPKLLVEGSDAGGAEGALVRAEQAFEGVEIDLSVIDPDAGDGAYRALRELRRLVDARASTAQVEAAVDAVEEQLQMILPETFGR